MKFVMVFDGGLEKALQKKRTEIKTIEKIHDDLSYNLSN